jgi:hypothetical protein
MRLLIAGLLVRVQSEELRPWPGASAAGAFKIDTSPVHHLWPGEDLVPGARRRPSPLILKILWSICTSWSGSRFSPSTAIASPMRTPVARNHRVGAGRSRRTATASASSRCNQDAHSSMVRLRASPSCSHRGGGGLHVFEPPFSNDGDLSLAHRRLSGRRGAYDEGLVECAFRRCSRRTSASSRCRDPGGRRHRLPRRRPQREGVGQHLEAPGAAD